MEPKFNINREKPSEEEINSKKNFDELVKKFKQESIEKAKKDTRLPRLRKIVYSSIIAGVAVVCTVFYMNEKGAIDPLNISNNIKDTKNTIEQTAKKKTINPIHKKATLPYTAYKVNASKGGEINHSTKSKIKIPANSFVKKDGSAVVGEIDIQYREMHDVADILASGIPMTYDSAGVKYHFESSGMCEIKGSQNNEEVFIAPGKSLEVNLHSNNPDPKFNVYALDSNNNWVFKGKDVITHQEEPKLTEQEIKKLKQEAETKIALTQKVINEIPRKKDSTKTSVTKKINGLAKVIKPLEPRKSNPSRQKLSVDVNENEFPEFASYRDVVFEVGEENKHFTPELASVVYENMELNQGTIKGENYKLKLYKGSQAVEILVYPVMDGLSYTKAKSLFDQKFETYKTAAAKRADDEKRLKDELEAKLKVFETKQALLQQQIAQQKLEIEKLKNDAKNQLATENRKAEIFRTFQISNFGVHNTDCAKSFPQGQIVDASFTLDGKPLNPTYVYLIQKDENAVYTYNDDYFANFSYNPKKDNYIITNIGDKVYLCNEGDFKKTSNQNNKQTFKMKDITADIDSFGKFKEMLASK